MNRGTSTQHAVRFAVIAALLALVGVAVSYQYNETLTSHAQRRVLPYRQSVVIYEDPNFGGRSKALAVGNYALTDFASSSIRVPAGLAAIIYEHADAGGGYGISVDLLEDQPDLSRFNLNKRVSYVAVFSVDRQGFFWARNSIQNGQFVSGHWERARAGRNPINTVAVVSPPLPPHAPTGATTIQVNDAQSTITSLGVQSAADAITWNGAETDRMGVIGSDFKGPEEIGSAAFERASNNWKIPDWINFWYPQKQPNDHRRIVYFKRTLVGTISDTVDGVHEKTNTSGDAESDSSSEPHIANINDTYPDHDLNVDIIPDPKYMYLIKEGHEPSLSGPESAKLTGENIRLHNPGGGHSNPCTQPFRIVEAEIDARTPAKYMLVKLLGRFRPLDCDTNCLGDCYEFRTKQDAYQRCLADCKKKCKTKPPPVGTDGRIGKQIAVYGPWIYDKGHCYHPEIHPAEQIWWSENVGRNRQYNLNLFCDSSRRFWWRNQMDDGTKLKPWGAPPIKGTFAIAFEVKIDGLGPVSHVLGKKFEVTNVEDYDVAVIPNSDKIYNLVYQNNVLVSFVPHNDAFKVSFEGVGLKPGTTNVVRGFLVIETTVGTLTQIATSIPNNPLGIGKGLTFPLGTDPNQVPQIVEEMLFKKVEGHYMFSVLRTDISSQVIPPRRLP